jgi:hypothetical protein
MRSFAAVWVVFAGALAGWSPQGAAGEKAAPDYFPLKVGTKWHYRAEVGGKMLQVTNRIAKIEKIDGKPVALLETVLGGQVTATEHLRATPKGVFRYRYNGMDVSPPLCLLRYPVKKGDSWESELKIGGEQLKAMCRVGTEDIKVPAGKYKTVTSRVDADAGGLRISTTCWFAPGVGMVKQTADIGGQMITLELEKYEPAK